MTKLFFAGAEQPSHRNLLVECGVNRFAINLTNLDRLVSGTWDVAEHLPDGAEWIAYADKGTTWNMAQPFVAQKPLLVMGPWAWSEHFTPNLGQFAPFWEPGIGTDFPILGLTDETVKASVSLRRIMSQHAMSVLAAVTGSTRGVERLDIVCSYAWTHTQRYGETQVWSGNKMHRYAGNRKTEARPKHRADIERLGVDYEAVERDDSVETARLAILSWQEWEARYSTPTRPTISWPDNTTPPLEPSNVVDMSSHEEYSDQDGTGSSRSRLALVPTATGHQPREQVLLPGITMQDNDRLVVDGNGVERTETTKTVITLGTSFRRCDTCYLAANCPAFQRGSMCAFNIPVEARTKDQLQAIMQAAVEMQMQRVAFARYAEQLDGQGVDGALSGEIDRLFVIMAKMKDILDDSTSFRFEMQAKGNNGVLSRLFGEGVGAAARALPIPVSSDEVLHAFDP